MGAWTRSFAVLVLVVAWLGCGSSLGAGDPDAEVYDTGVSFDAASTDAAADCTAQDITGCADPCVTPVGVYWDGSACVPILCCCEGPDCANTYDSAEECRAAHSTCELDACATTGGYCDYGDFADVPCWSGYGSDYSTGACGLGKCCTPCPDAKAPGVHYVSQDPTACAATIWTCSDTQTSFDSECGCGCLDQPGAVGDTCGQSADGRPCQDELVCCYPCGVAGCDFQCAEPCKDTDPGCSGGCYQFP